MHSKITEDENGIITSQLEKDTCPACGYTLDAATGVQGNEIPGPGDISICINCASVLEFGPTLKLKLFSELELKKLSKEELDDISFAQSFIRKQRGMLH